MTINAFGIYFYYYKQKWLEKNTFYMIRILVLFSWAVQKLTNTYMNINILFLEREQMEDKFIW
jgi:hypothetical protein